MGSKVWILNLINHPLLDAIFSFEMFTLLVNRFSISFHGEAFSSRTFTILYLVRTLWIALKVCFEGFIKTSTALSLQMLQMWSFRKKLLETGECGSFKLATGRLKGIISNFFFDSLLTPISENFRQIIWHFDLTRVRRLILIELLNITDGDSLPLMVTELMAIECLLDQGDWF